MTIERNPKVISHGELRNEQSWRRTMTTVGVVGGLFAGYAFANWAGDGGTHLRTQDGMTAALLGAVVVLLCIVAYLLRDIRDELRRR